MDDWSPQLDKGYETAEDFESIRRGLAQSLAGEGRPLSEFRNEFEAKYGQYTRDSSLSQGQK